ncbi:MAG: hypothetical protein IPM51_09385 [Sphingobacteriaceae bacterium]|nr:hypothetical protein [Sphingobacteriaceae bacterium]
MRTSLGLLFLMMSFFTQVNLFAQTISIEQVLAFTHSSTDFIETTLLKENWKRRSLEIVPDSNLVKRSWEVMIKGESIKSYVLHFEFTKDTIENYVVYQFSEREEYKQIKKKMKSMGYAHLNSEKRRKRAKTKDEHIHSEKEDYYYNKNTKSLIVVKEVFFYGLFSFLVYSYKPNSLFGDHVIRPYIK